MASYFKEENAKIICEDQVQMTVDPYLQRGLVLFQKSSNETNSFKKKWQPAMRSSRFE